MHDRAAEPDRRRPRQRESSSRRGATGRTITRVAPLLAIAVLGPALAGNAGAAELLPDLRVAAPDLAVFDARVEPGKVVLRIDTEVQNRGRGAMALVGTRPDATTPTMTTIQRVFGDDGAATDAPTPITLSPGSTAAWQADGIVRHRIAGRGTRRSADVGACLTDRFRIGGKASIAGSPFTGCGGAGDVSALLGILPGHSSWLPARDQERFLDVTGLRPGRYVVTLTADPRNLIRESNERNNSRRIALRLPAIQPILSGKTRFAARFNGRRKAVITRASFSHAGRVDVAVFRQIRRRAVVVGRARGLKVKPGARAIRWKGRGLNRRLLRPGRYSVKLVMTVGRRQRSAPLYTDLIVRR